MQNILKCGLYHYTASIPHYILTNAYALHVFPNGVKVDLLLNLKIIMNSHVNLAIDKKH